jgi:hypothetical protein
VFAGTLDGASWIADTAVSIASGSSADTTLVISGVRRVSAQEEQQITLVLRGLGPPGQYQLADTAGQAVAAFTVSQTAGGTLVSTVVYWSEARNPGSLSITEVDRTDSVVTGRFAFEAAMAPESAPHRHVSGHFRIRFVFQSVYTQGAPRMPPSQHMKVSAGDRSNASR